MKKKSHTNVHFDYGGYYSEGNEWIYKNSLYAISFKTACLEKITYSVLLDKITTKVGQNGVPGNLRLSYNLSKARRETYIVDDEDVYIFLTECDEEGRIPVLHVELLSDNNQRVEVLVPERRSSVGVNYVELVNVNEGMEVVAVERSMDNHLDEDVDGMFDFDDIPAIPNRVKGTPKNIEWEDGTGIELYQEFCSKEALWELVNKAAKQLVYGVLTIKSDPLRLMLRCKQYSQGCKWYLRVARTKQSDYWSVRVHRKIHTCSRSVESTSNSVQRGTPRLIAAVLHADFPGNLQTPNPKSIMSIVTGRLGVHCSYSTALRGKMQHVSEVRGGPEKSYKMLFSYLYMLEKVNRGTVTSVELEEKKFKYLFIALGASIEDMPYSYSQPSTSAESINSGGRNADANYGVPKRCFCGLMVKLERCITGQRQGERVYICPLLTDGDEYKVNRDHLVQWWDCAVTEELSKINLRFDVLTSLESARAGFPPALESIRETLRLMREEIDALKARLATKEVEIARLKGLLSSW
ncbi:unnamed protein product [Arabidopsis arenosa]|uniref:MULE transposase N-terminal all-beta domain-containing protein n=1 Tax=Arabidopsis arenosa TaxID=38785 RepID=A0A8S1ZYI7_ARAAE|nr:unnamed protein product [Arabidopsis arenosa]